MKKLIINVLPLLFTLFISGNVYSTKNDSSNITLSQIDNRLVAIESSISKVEKTHIEKYGGIYVGLIALLGVLYAATRQYKNTKGQAVANFRMKWLEDFRILCSDLQVALDNIAFKSMDGKLKNVEKTVYAEDKDFIIARTAYHRLRLMVNTKKPENNIFLDHISEYIDKHIKYYNEEKDAPTFAELKELKLRYLELTEEKLYNAWNKAKKLK